MVNIRLPSVASYNVRSLRSRASGSQAANMGRRCILANVVKLCSLSDITFLQETNLPFLDRHYLSAALPGHEVFYNNCININTAGTAFVIKKSFLRDFTIPSELQSPCISGYYQPLVLAPRQDSVSMHINLLGVYLPSGAVAPQIHPQ